MTLHVCSCIVPKFFDMPLGPALNILITLRLRGCACFCANPPLSLQKPPVYGYKFVKLGERHPIAAKAFQVRLLCDLSGAAALG